MSEFYIRSLKNKTYLDCIRCPCCTNKPIDRGEVTCSESFTTPKKENEKFKRFHLKYYNVPRLSFPTPQFLISCPNASKTAKFVRISLTADHGHFYLSPISLGENSKTPVYIRDFSIQDRNDEMSIDFMYSLFIMEDVTSNQNRNLLIQSDPSYQSSKKKMEFEGTNFNDLYLYKFRCCKKPYLVLTMVNTENTKKLMIRQDTNDVEDDDYLQQIFYLEKFQES